MGTAEIVGFISVKTPPRVGEEEGEEGGEEEKDELCSRDKNKKNQGENLNTSAKVGGAKTGCHSAS